MGLDTSCKSPRGATRPRVASSIAGPPAGPLWALAVVGAATGLCWATRAWFGLAEEVMVYVVGVLLTASWLSRRDALLCALASVVALDYFFVPPAFDFAPTDLRHLWTLAAFLATSVVVSSLAMRVRRQAAAAIERERRMAALYALARALSARGDVEGIAVLAAERTRESLGLDAAVFLPDPKSGVVAIAGADAEVARSEPEREAARWVLAHARPAGPGVGGPETARGVHLPLATGSGTRGVLSVGSGGRSVRLAAASREFLDAVAALTAVALERAVLADEAQRARVFAETERARNTLLSAVSHDLRTPLASVTGALGALLAPGSNLTDEARRRLLVSSHTQSERLGRLVTNLLELARVEAGGGIEKTWYPLDELVASAVEHARPALGGRRVDVALPAEVVQVRVDGVLVEQVLVNLLDNAAKHTPAKSPVELRVEAEADEVVVLVLDRGAGIPEDDLDRVFEAFRRLRSRRDAEGTGLGLALCRAIVTAHGGRITAENRPGGGSVFRVRIPREEEPAAPAEEPRAPAARTT